MGGFTSFSLTPHQGEWSADLAAHLLRRTTYGPTADEVRSVVDMGLEASLKVLLEDLPSPELPIHFRTSGDSVPRGQTWVDVPYDRSINNQVGTRLASLNAWTTGQLIESRLNIREKMVLFWHNHFVISNIRDASFVYHNLNIYRSQPLGNFRTLTKQTTIDPAMLRYLNGRQNTRNRPNENYARELLELFTIGKGPTVSEGDYTHYTEQDVAEIARVLTGWRDQGYFSRDGLTPQSTFRPQTHDRGTKQLSHRFDNIRISDMGESEYSHLIDIIFQKDEVARFICRKLYRWFVYYEISPEVEATVIEPLAMQLVSADYEIASVVHTLLSSEHFFDNYAIGSMIKNPLDFTIGLARDFKVAVVDNPIQKYFSLLRLSRLPFLLEMRYYDPPTVAGWKAYYQEPLFYRTWINSSTLSFRYLIMQNLINGIGAGLSRLQADVLAMLDTVDESLDVNSVVSELASQLLPHALTEDQAEDLKSKLIPGLPDYEWTVEYEAYLSDPSNDEIKGSIENRLRAMVLGLVSMAEYQLS